MDETVIRFECPACSQPVEMELSQAKRGLNCPGCFKFFTPKEVTAERCQKCGSPKIKLNDNWVWCEQCSRYSHQITPPAPASSFSATTAAILERDGRAAADRQKQIRGHAKFLEIVAIIFAAIGMLALLLAGVALDGHNAVPYFIICGSAFGGACWLYLIAQIIHIRANTEK